jgi:hypothetical protein
LIDCLQISRPARVASWVSGGVYSVLLDDGIAITLSRRGPLSVRNNSRHKPWRFEDPNGMARQTKSHHPNLYRVWDGRWKIRRSEQFLASHNLTTTWSDEMGFPCKARTRFYKNNSPCLSSRYREPPMVVGHQISHILGKRSQSKLSQCQPAAREMVCLVWALEGHHQAQH